MASPVVNPRSAPLLDIGAWVSPLQILAYVGLRLIGFGNVILRVTSSVMLTATTNNS